MKHFFAECNKIIFNFAVDYKRLRPRQVLGSSYYGSIYSALREYEVIHINNPHHKYGSKNCGDMNIAFESEIYNTSETYMHHFYCSKIKKVEK